MANLTITAANIIGAGDTEQIPAGASLTAGQVVYKDAADGDKAKLSDADVIAAAKLQGITLNNAATGQPIVTLKNGTLGGLAGVVVGMIYCLSATPGAICPYTDLGADDRLIIIGYGISSSEIKLDIKDTGIVLAA